MALHRAIFSVTCDNHGQGYADVSLKLPSTLTRHALLTAVTIDVGDAAKKNATVAISQLDDVSAETWNDSAEDYSLGDQLVFIDLDATNVYPSRDDVYEFAPRRASVISPTGAVPSFGDAEARPLIRTKKLRCEVNGGGSTDVFTVNAYYETAGDYRF